MPVYVGCDVGTVGVKAAVLTDEPGPFSAAESTGSFEELPHRSALLTGWSIFVLPYRRVRSDPLGSALELIQAVFSVVPKTALAGLCVTGAGGRLVGSRLGIRHENEFRALARGIGLLYPDVAQVFEVGGEKARLLALSADPVTGEVGIGDYEISGECAAGTGSFLDQQAARLRYRIEEVGDVALSAERASKIAGRCSVFAKTDMIHAQQKGAAPQEVLRGLCEAVARNFEAAVVKGRKPGSRVAFVGGVAENRAVIESLRTVMDLDGQLFSPSFPAHYGAIGAALLAKEQGPAEAASRVSLPEAVGGGEKTSFPAWEPLDLTGVLLLRDRVEPYRFPVLSGPVEVYLGVDIGSVSTNVVLVDGEGELIHEIYLRTEGRPVEVVGRGLREIQERFGRRIAVCGSATTGSGRELIGELIGADAVHDEITAHKTGAFRIAQRYLGCGVDTIFEIGGQDAKYIHLRDGVVVNFAMNEACAAGTGSFLEEQAAKLGVRIEGEFSRLALESGSPLKLGERCTVFMERDVARCQQEGAELRDLVAGLAYGVVENYLNRVVRGRPVGEMIFFQGGTAYNDAVAAAFAKVLGKRIVVPPHNGVVGAYGAALLAREKVLALGAQTSFRGYDIDAVDRRVRSFTCSGCTNRCDIQEFTIEGKKSYWGDKCSEKYRREAKVAVTPATEDLLKVREEALFSDYLERFREGGGPLARDAEKAARWAENRGSGLTLAVPRAMYFYEQHPFWGTYLRGLGFRLEISGATTKELANRGVGAAVAEPCFPIQVAHGHAVSLLHGSADAIFLPNVISAAAPDAGGRNAYLCPWGQTLPFVVAACPEAAGARVLAPTVHFQLGPKIVERELWEAVRQHGVSRRHHRAALALAYGAQEAFRATLLDAGSRALAALRTSGQPGLVLVGRPYNLYDAGINLNIPKKLRSLYGVNVIPLDFLPLEDVDIWDVGSNMYWNYGRKILQAARISSRDPKLHLLYLTNFKCGPDSYVKQFADDAAVKPFLVLQFDGHGNDAGAMTRCEAYLDSIGALRWWKEASTAGPSSCPGCATTGSRSSRLRSAA